jgi:hypothetical protein
VAGWWLDGDLLGCVSRTKTCRSGKAMMEPQALDLLVFGTAFTPLKTQRCFHWLLDYDHTNRQDNIYSTTQGRWCETERISGRTFLCRRVVYLRAAGTYGKRYFSWPGARHRNTANTGDRSASEYYAQMGRNVRGEEE